jgi:hypothetical protein
MEYLDILYQRVIFADVVLIAGLRVAFGYAKK